MAVISLMCSGGCTRDFLLSLGNTQRNHHAEADAPHPWAQAVDVLGSINVHQVDADLYRGGQPDAQGMRQLARMGIRTVVNLRVLHSDRDLVAGTGMDLVEIAIVPWDIQAEQVAQFLRVVGDPRRVPVYVHCSGGADRTGVVVAAYRMVKYGWTAEHAIAEMTEGGYYYHSFWSGLVRNLRRIDMDEVRRLAGHPAGVTHGAPRQTGPSPPMFQAGEVRGNARRRP